MNLYINSPMYFTNEFGINDDIYKFCWAISCSINILRYTNKIDSIAITPIIAPSSELQKENLKEFKYVSLNYRFANIVLTIDYDKYLNGDNEVKKELMLENIINSIKIVKKKIRKDFDYELFTSDLEQVLIKNNEIEILNNIKNKK